MRSVVGHRDAVRAARAAPGRVRGCGVSENPYPEPQQHAVDCHFEDEPCTAWCAWEGGRHPGQWRRTLPAVPLVIRGNAEQLPLPDSSVDLIVTSPPYFGLRSYTDGGQHYAGQVGDEQTPTEYLDRLIACTREWLRLLKPSGSLFVNLGDKYVADNRGSGNDMKRGEAKHAPAGPLGYVGRDMAPRKSLMLLPQRYAIRCVDELGLVLRAEIVWSKPNGLPESVTDRVRRSHEQVFHFTQQQRYYSAVDEIRESAVYARPQDYDRGARGGTRARTFSDVCNPLGKLPGSVWQIPTSPLQVPAHLGVDHFAAYPRELVRRIVLGWSPREVCQQCGEGRRPVARRLEGDGRARSTTSAKDPSWQAIKRADWQENVRRVITGYVCACPDTLAPASPGVVLDPFGGTGTTALVASCHGRLGVSVDLSHDYSRLARWRTRDPGERARVLQVEKPPTQIDGQLGMFDGVT